jgi:hypothetical protein
VLLEPTASHQVGRWGSPGGFLWENWGFHGIYYDLAGFFMNKKRQRYGFTMI